MNRVEKGSRIDVTVIIPSFNEERTIRNVISECIESLQKYKFIIIVVDDGSSDRTGSIAQALGARVIRHRRNRGVAQAVQTGLTHALQHKTKVLVQLDADGQHSPGDIEKLIKPILEDRADLVIGQRIYQSWKPPVSKRFGNWLLTWVTNHLADTKLKDAQSGFRAISSDLARSLRLTSRNTYVHEMIIRASREGFRIIQVQTDVYARKEGESKVVRSIASYASGATITIIRVYRDYEPLRFFGGIGATLISFGCIMGILVLFGLLKGTVGFRTVFLFFGIGIQIILFGFLADMMKSQ